MQTSKRLDALLRATAGEAADSFAFYALAMEYRSLGRVDEAIAAFERLRARDPDYLPMYMMCGTMLAARADRAGADAWLRAGLLLAKKQKNEHTASEIESAIDALEP